MVTKENISTKKQLSAGKAVLAILWLIKEASREKLFSHKYIRLLCKNKNRAVYRTCISRLSSRKAIKKDYNNIIILTEKGKRMALFAFIEAELRLFDPSADKQQWDGGWRLIFFDIPEKKRLFRDYLRKVLKIIGFKEFQKSIWAYPYPVPAFLKEFIFYEEIKPYVRFISTSGFDGDKNLRELFELD